MSSPFTAQQLRAWRGRLVAVRDGLVGDLERLAAESASDAESPPPTAAREAVPVLDETLATSDNAEAIIAEVDRALRRIDRAEPCPFGICEATGAVIEPERLELMPWTAWCARAAARAEGGASPRAAKKTAAR
jgi:RNA polymerase-binding transcription factor DksA